MTRIGCLDVVRFRPEHAEALNMRIPDAEWAENLGAPIAAQARMLAIGPSISLVRDGEVVACGGAMVVWRDVAEIWMRTSPLVEVYPLAVVKTTRRFLAAVWQDFALRRMQCVVRADYDRAIRFAARLGFEREALLRRYGPDGHDYFMCARVA